MILLLNVIREKLFLYILTPFFLFVLVKKRKGKESLSLRRCSEKTWDRSHVKPYDRIYHMEPPYVSKNSQFSNQKSHVSNHELRVLTVRVPSPLYLHSIFLPTFRFLQRSNNIIQQH